jgi:hypothetical protein
MDEYRSAMTVAMAYIPGLSLAQQGKMDHRENMLSRNNQEKSNDMSLSRVRQ